MNWWIFSRLCLHIDKLMRFWDKKASEERHTEVDGLLWSSNRRVILMHWRQWKAVSRGVRFAKNDFALVFGSAKKCGFRFDFNFTKLTAISVCRFGFLHCDVTYFRAELVQLIVSRSDSELEVQRHSMKKNTLTVDPIMLEDELWMRQREKPSTNCQSRFFENRTAETEFSVFEFWGHFGLVWFLENRYPTFSLSSTQP